MQSCVSSARYQHSFAMQGHGQVRALLLAGFAVAEGTLYHLLRDWRMLGAASATEALLPLKH